MEKAKRPKHVQMAVTCVVEVKVTKTGNFLYITPELSDGNDTTKFEISPSIVQQLSQVLTNPKYKG